MAQRNRQAACSILIGRIPNTAGGIGLEAAGVCLDARGFIRFNERLETTAPDVWAIGDCAGSPQFTHVSVDDFRIIRDNLAGSARSTTTGWCRTACSRIRPLRISG
jgi:pyruvate/2-oxoglutarate dehydrogenase complex dihydrolipoamide dehydrogenase (E3) component